MKAPDKIFISIERTYGASNGQVIGMAVPHSEKQSENDIEYIRKDALLEWVKNLKEKWEEPPMSKHSPGCVFMLEQVIKKIESL